MYRTLSSRLVFSVNSWNRYIKYSLSIQCILFHRRSSFLLFSDTTIIILYIKIINLLTKTLRRSFSFSIFYKLSTQPANHMHAVTYVKKELIWSVRGINYMYYKNSRNQFIYLPTTLINIQIIVVKEINYQIMTYSPCSKMKIICIFASPTCD